MKLVGLVSRSVLSFVVLSFLFGTTALTYAQDQRDEAKPPQQETRPEASKQDEPTSRQGEAKPAEQSEDKPARGEDKPARQENAKPSRQSGGAGQSTEHAQRSATIVGAAFPTTSSAPNSAANTRLKSTARLRLRANRVSNTGATRSSLLTYGPRIGPTLTTAMSTTSTGNIFCSTCFILALESRLL